MGQFDVPVMLISLVVFMVTYELLMYAYSERIKKISIKEIMIESQERCPVPFEK